MGIKTRFNPMGGDATGGGEPRPSIPDAWSYTTRTNETGKEVRTLYFYNNAIGGNEVKVPYGYTELQDYYSTNNTYSSLPFHDHNTLTSVDLKNVPFKNNSMYNAFRDCQNLISISGINNSVTNMSRTFSYCSNLNQNIQIPSSVTNMSDTFVYCSNLNQNIQIPSSVTNIPDTFYHCSNLNQNIQIHSSVTNMYFTFGFCENLNQNIQIPSSVTNMSGTFSYCRNLGNYHKTINILSEKVTNTLNAFYGTSYHNISNQLTIVFPLRYINNVNTVTRNSLVSAGYAVGAGTGVTTANATENRNLLCFDWIAGDWNTYTGNGTHWVLQKWNGKLSSYFNNNTVVTDVKVPNSITTYDTFPTAMTSACFSVNKIVTSIDCQHTPFNGTNTINAFRNCINMKNITNVNIDVSTITSIYGTFCNMRNCTKISSTTGVEGVGDVYIPDSVTNAQTFYSSCKSIDTFFVKGNNIKSVAFMLDYCNTRPWNIYISSPVVTNVVNFSRSYNTSHQKNIYIYFNYANNVRTATFNAFKAAVYSGTSGNGTSVTEMYNSTSNFHVQDLCRNSFTNLKEFVYAKNTRRLTFIYPYSENSTVVIPSTIKYYPYPDTEEEAQLTGLDLTFCNITNFNSNVQIPDGITGMVSTFEGCTNFNQNIQIPSSVTDMSYTFYNCTNLRGRINILSENVLYIERCFGGTEAPKDVYIPYKYSNGEYTQTYNTFQTAGYFGGINGVTMHDINNYK